MATFLDVGRDIIQNYSVSLGPRLITFASSLANPLLFPLPNQADRANLNNNPPGLEGHSFADQNIALISSVASNIKLNEIILAKRWIKVMSDNQASSLEEVSSNVVSSYFNERIETLNVLSQIFQLYDSENELQKFIKEFCHELCVSNFVSNALVRIREIFDYIKCDDCKYGDHWRLEMWELCVSIFHYSARIQCSKEDVLNLFRLFKENLPENILFVLLYSLQQMLDLNYAEFVDPRNKCSIGSNKLGFDTSLYKYNFSLTLVLIYSDVNVIFAELKLSKNIDSLLSMIWSSFVFQSNLGVGFLNTLLTRAVVSFDWLIPCTLDLRVKFARVLAVLFFHAQWLDSSAFQHIRQLTNDDPFHSFPFDPVDKYYVSCWSGGYTEDRDEDTEMSSLEENPLVGLTKLYCLIIELISKDDVNDFFPVFSSLFLYLDEEISFPSPMFPYLVSFIKCLSCKGQIKWLYDAIENSRQLNWNQAISNLLERCVTLYSPKSNNQIRIHYMESRVLSCVLALISAISQDPFNREKLIKFEEILFQLLACKFPTFLKASILAAITALVPSNPLTIFKRIVESELVSGFNYLTNELELERAQQRYPLVLSFLELTSALVESLGDRNEIIAEMKSFFEWISRNIFLSLHQLDDFVYAALDERWALANSCCKLYSRLISIGSAYVIELFSLFEMKEKLTSLIHRCNIQDNIQSDNIYHTLSLFYELENLNPNGILQAMHVTGPLMRVILLALTVVDSNFVNNSVSFVASKLLLLLLKREEKLAVQQLLVDSLFIPVRSTIADQLSVMFSDNEEWKITMLSLLQFCFNGKSIVDSKDNFAFVLLGFGPLHSKRNDLNYLCVLSSFLQLCLRSQSLSPILAESCFHLLSTLVSFEATAKTTLKELEKIYQFQFIVPSNSLTDARENYIKIPAIGMLLNSFGSSSFAVSSDVSLNCSLTYCRSWLLFSLSRQLMIAVSSAKKTGINERSILEHTETIDSILNYLDLFRSVRTRGCQIVDILDDSLSIFSGNFVVPDMLEQKFNSCLIQSNKKECLPTYSMPLLSIVADGEVLTRALSWNLFVRTRESIMKLWESWRTLVEVSCDAVELRSSQKTNNDCKLVLWEIMLFTLEKLSSKSGFWIKMLPVSATSIILTLFSGCSVPSGKNSQQKMLGAWVNLLSFAPANSRASLYCWFFRFANADFGLSLNEFPSLLSSKTVKLILERALTDLFADNDRELRVNSCLCIKTLLVYYPSDTTFSKETLSRFITVLSLFHKGSLNYFQDEKIEDYAWVILYQSVLQIFMLVVSSANSYGKNGSDDLVTVGFPDVLSVQVSHFSMSAIAQREILESLSCICRIWCVMGHWDNIKLKSSLSDFISNNFSLFSGIIRDLATLHYSKRDDPDYIFKLDCCHCLLSIIWCARSHSDSNLEKWINIILKLLYKFVPSSASNFIQETDFSEEEINVICVIVSLLSFYCRGDKIILNDQLEFHSSNHNLNEKSVALVVTLIYYVCNKTTNLVVNLEDLERNLVLKNGEVVANKVRLEKIENLLKSCSMILEQSSYLLWHHIDTYSRVHAGKVKLIQLEPLLTLIPSMLSSMKVKNTAYVNSILSSIRKLIVNSL